MSFEKLAHGTVESKLQLHKSSEQSIEQSSNASKFQAIDVEKSLKTSESISKNVISTSQRMVSTSATIVQSVKSSVSSTEITEIEFE